jgi:hypothetical protein
VKVAAESVLRRFSAIVSLRLTSFRKPHVDAVVFEGDDGSRKIVVSAVGRIEARSKLVAVAEVVGPDGQVKPGQISTPEQELFAKSDGHSALDAALTLWADANRTWPRLYRILEEVERHLGRKVDVAELCAAAQRERFARTANSAEVAGEDSRHAAGRFAPPANPMTRAEASDFVRVMLLKALEGTRGENQ